MARQRNMLPFGYEIPVQGEKGSLFVMDSFESFGEMELYKLQDFAEQRMFSQVIFYPFHEETLKRMGIKYERTYVNRVNELEYLLEQVSIPNLITIEKWEGKRKKYTPMDVSLNYLTEKYPAPHFIYLSGEAANLFASYPAFDAWIRKLRLFIEKRNSNVSIHPKLEAYQHRWEYV